MVTKPNTVIKPVAMMIKSVDTSVANEAVSRFLWPEDFTSWTDEGWIKVLVQLQERYSFRLFHIARIAVTCHKKEYVCKDQMDYEWLGIAL